MPCVSATKVLVPRSLTRTVPETVLAPAFFLNLGGLGARSASTAREPRQRA